MGGLYGVYVRFRVEGLALGARLIKGGYMIWGIVQGTVIGRMKGDTSTRS